MSSAQTTQPSAQPAPPPPPVTWSGVVEQFARATEKGDVPTVVAALTRDAQVRAFEAPDQVAAARSMIDAAAEWKLLGAHAYEFPPASLAGDIAADVKASDLVPEAEKRKIIPIDDTEKSRANTTAADWMAQTLGAERNQPVAVALYWHTRDNRPMFVLLKGQESRDGYAVKMAVYGDPMAARRPQQASVK